MRRRTAVALVAGSALVASGCGFGRWPMFGFGPAHTSYNAGESAVTVDSAPSLREAWTAVLGAPQGGSAAPVVADGVVFATSGVSSGSTPFKIEAFDAAGTEGCSGTPTRCRPLWTGALKGFGSTLNVADGLVYVTTGAGFVYAFDAAGVNGCSGTPKTCKPRWRATGLSSAGSLTIANGFVFAAAGDRIVVFDAAGVKDCSGTPNTCQPLWSVPGWKPSVSKGVLYASRFGPDYQVVAYDAAGVKSCSGTPRTCRPLWTGKTGNTGDIMGSVTEPSAANGLVLVGITQGDERSTSGRVYGFSAVGSSGCSGTPKVCTPIWQAPSLGAAYPPAIAKNVVYTIGYSRLDTTLGASRTMATTGNVNVLRAFDVDACRTTSLRCQPRWSADLGELPQGLSVAGSVVYVSTLGSTLSAYDAAGRRSCSGTPTVCSPLWSTTVVGAPTPAAIADGTVYVGSQSANTLHAYSLP